MRPETGAAEDGSSEYANCERSRRKRESLCEHASFSQASSLFLFEKPGPMTADQAGSGFISRNNDDPTAEATYNFMQQAQLPRKETILWNLIPWWNGTRKVTTEERNRGLSSLSELMSLLHRLKVIVLVGRNAERANAIINELGVNVIISAHPSPLVRARWRDRWNDIPHQWAKITFMLPPGVPAPMHVCDATRDC